MTPAGTSNELDVQNEWEEDTRTHTIPGVLVYRKILRMNVSKPSTKGLGGNIGRGDKKLYMVLKGFPNGVT